MADFTPPEDEFSMREDRARRINGRRPRSTSGTGTGSGGATLDDILAELKKSNAANKAPTAEDKRNSEGDRQRKAAERAEDEKRKKSWFSRFASTKTTGKRTGGKGKHDWSLDVDPKTDTTGAAIKRGIGATIATTLLGPAAPLVMTSVGLYKEFGKFFKWDKKTTEDKKKKDKADKAKDDDLEETRARETKEANKKLRKEISDTKKLLGKKLDGIKSSSLGLMGKLGGIGKLFGTKLKGLGAAFAVGFGKVKGLLGKGVKAGGRILGRGARMLGRGAKGIGGLLGRGAGLLGRGAASLLTNPAVMGTLLAGAAGVWIGKQLNKLIPDEWKEKIGNFIGYMVELPGKMKAGWNALMTDAGKMFGDFWKSAKDKWGELSDWIGKKLGWVKKNIIKPVKAVGGAVADAGLSTGAAAGHWLKDTYTAAVDVTSRGMEKAANTGTSIKEGVGKAWSGAKSVVGGVVSMAEGAYNAVKDKITGGPSEFVSKIGPLAQQVGSALGVAPRILLGQWGLETGWGKSVIPGTNNLGNVKEFNPKKPGVAATDSMNGSRDRYKVFPTLQDFGNYYIGLVNRKYKGAIGAGDDAEKFATALKKGGYAEDPNYIKSLVSTAGRAGKILGPSGSPQISVTGTNYAAATGGGDAGTITSKGSDVMKGGGSIAVPEASKGSDMMANTPVQLAGGAAGGSLTMGGGGLGSGIPSAPSTSIGVGGATPIAESFDRASASKGTGEGTVLASNKPQRSFAGMSAGGNKTRMDDIPFYIDDMGLLVMNSGYVG